MKRASMFLIFFICLFKNLTAQQMEFFVHELYQTSTKIFFVKNFDFNLDSNKDILFTEPADSCLNYFRKTEGNNYVKENIGFFKSCNSVSPCDWDKDGDMDLLACSYDSSQIVLFLDSGNQQFHKIMVSDSILHPLMILSADIENDGDPDIICAAQDAGTGTILLNNNGNDKFDVKVLGNAAYNGTWIEIIDFDTDGDLDILGNDFSANGGVIWYEQTNHLLFAEHFIECPMVHGFAIADLNNDNFYDLATASCGSQIRWYKNENNQNFVPFVLNNSFSCAVVIRAADLNNDAVIDLIATAWSGNKIGYWQNLGSGTFDYYCITDTILRPNALDVDDVNSDGFMDVVMGSYSGKLNWYEQNSGNRIQEILQKKIAEIFYSNSEKQIKISLKETKCKPAIVCIYNTQGNIIRRNEINSSDTIDCSLFSPGVYFIQIVLDTVEQKQKIIIN